ncbi:hypothetical protein [Pontibacter beigongshangensis]|uniref:hypothetical protein n=1 Tax=Pontibacter beigongshangensis TaxID=2574733 RepID=UPI0016500B1E|nr:hypothetical protein [Pontibacter beigongshangensis]
MDTLLEGVHEYRNPYLHVVVDKGTRLLYSEWTRQPTSEEYRAAAYIFADFLQKEAVLYWIQDTTNLQDVSVQDLNWVLGVLVPLASQSTLTKLARITCHNHNMEQFKRLAREVQTELSSEIEVRQFKSYREAAEWIEGISAED